VLGEVAGRQRERGGEQLERAAAGPLMTAGEIGDVPVREATTGRVDLSRDRSQ
jgi:hypothetical protein